MMFCAPIPDGPNDIEPPTCRVVKVLSPSTERCDRGGKFAQYRRLESPHEYVLVSQNEMRVGWYTRRDDGQWLYHKILP